MRNGPARLAAWPSTILHDPIKEERASCSDIDWQLGGSRFFC